MSGRGSGQFDDLYADIEDALMGSGDDGGERLGSEERSFRVTAPSEARSAAPEDMDVFGDDRSGALQWVGSFLLREGLLLTALELHQEASELLGGGGVASLGEAFRSEARLREVVAEAEAAQEAAVGAAADVGVAAARAVALAEEDEAGTAVSAKEVAERPGVASARLVAEGKAGPAAVALVPSPFFANAGAESLHSSLERRDQRVAMLEYRLRGAERERKQLRKRAKALERDLRKCEEEVTRLRAAGGGDGGGGGVGGVEEGAKDGVVEVEDRGALGEGEKRSLLLSVRRFLETQGLSMTTATLVEEARLRGVGAGGVDLQSLWKGSVRPSAALEAKAKRTEEAEARAADLQRVLHDTQEQMRVLQARLEAELGSREALPEEVDSPKKRREAERRGGEGKGGGREGGEEGEGGEGREGGEKKGEERGKKGKGGKEFEKAAGDPRLLFPALATCLPTLARSVPPRQRTQLLPLVAATAAAHPTASTRRAMLDLLLTLIRRPRSQDRVLILRQLDTLAKAAAAAAAASSSASSSSTSTTSTSTTTTTTSPSPSSSLVSLSEEIVPQVLTTATHRSRERRALAARACGLLAHRVEGRATDSLLATLAMLASDRSALVRREVVRGAADTAHAILRRWEREGREEGRSEGHTRRQMVELEDLMWRFVLEEEAEEDDEEGEEGVGEARGEQGADSSTVVDDRERPSTLAATTLLPAVMALAHRLRGLWTWLLPSLVSQLVQAVAAASTVALDEAAPYNACGEQGEETVVGAKKRGGGGKGSGGGGGGGGGGSGGGGEGGLDVDLEGEDDDGDEEGAGRDQAEDRERQLHRALALLRALIAAAPTIRRYVLLSGYSLEPANPSADEAGSFIYDLDHSDPHIGKPGTDPNDPRERAARAAKTLAALLRGAVTVRRRPISTASAAKGAEPETKEEEGGGGEGGGEKEEGEEGSGKGDEEKEGGGGEKGEEGEEGEKEKEKEKEEVEEEKESGDGKEKESSATSSEWEERSADEVRFQWPALRWTVRSCVCILLEALGRIPASSAINRVLRDGLTEALRALCDAFGTSFVAHIMQPAFTTLLSLPHEEPSGRHAEGARRLLADALLGTSTETVEEVVGEMRRSLSAANETRVLRALNMAGDDARRWPLAVPEMSWAWKMSGESMGGATLAPNLLPPLGAAVLGCPLLPKASSAALLRELVVRVAQQRDGWSSRLQPALEGCVVLAVGGALPLSGEDRQLGEGASSLSRSISVASTYSAAPGSVITATGSTVISSPSVPPPTPAPSTAARAHILSLLRRVSSNPDASTRRLVAGLLHAVAPVLSAHELRDEALVALVALAEAPEEEVAGAGARAVGNLIAASAAVAADASLREHVNNTVARLLRRGPRQVVVEILRALMRAVPTVTAEIRTGFVLDRLLETAHAIAESAAAGHTAMQEICEAIGDDENRADDLTDAATVAARRARDAAVQSCAPWDGAEFGDLEEAGTACLEALRAFADQSAGRRSSPLRGLDAESAGTWREAVRQLLDQEGLLDEGYRAVMRTALADALNPHVPDEDSEGGAGEDGDGGEETGDGSGEPTKTHSHGSMAAFLSSGAEWLDRKGYSDTHAGGGTAYDAAPPDPRASTPPPTTSSLDAFTGGAFADDRDDALLPDDDHDDGVTPFVPEGGDEEEKAGSKIGGMLGKFKQAWRRK